MPAEQQQQTIGQSPTLASVGPPVGHTAIFWYLLPSARPGKSLDRRMTVPVCTACSIWTGILYIVERVPPRPAVHLNANIAQAHLLSRLLGNDGKMKPHPFKSSYLWDCKIKKVALCSGPAGWQACDFVIHRLRQGRDRERRPISCWTRMI